MLKYLYLIALIFSTSCIVEKNEPSFDEKKQQIKPILDSLFQSVELEHIEHGYSTPPNSNCESMVNIKSHRKVFSNSYSESAFVVKFPEMWVDDQVLSNRKILEILNDDTILAPMIQNAILINDSLLDEPYKGTYDEFIYIANKRSIHCGLDSVYSFSNVDTLSVGWGARTIYLNDLAKTNTNGFKLPSGFQSSTICTSGKTTLNPWNNSEEMNHLGDTKFGIKDILINNEVIEDFFKDRYIPNHLTAYSPEANFVHFDLTLDSFELHNPSYFEKVVEENTSGFVSSTTFFGEIYPIECDRINSDVRSNEFYDPAYLNSGRFVIENVSSDK